MTDSGVLLFRSHQTLYAVDAAQVRELVWLPALAPVEELPAAWIGCLDLRGEVVPVLDLERRLGRPRTRYDVSEQLIVLDWARGAAALLVAEVRDVVPAAAVALKPAPAAVLGGGDEALVRGVLPVAGELALLLDLDRVFALTGGHVPGPSFDELVDPADADVLAQRARELRPALDLDGGVEARPLGVVAAGGEHFGVWLQQVHGFAELAALTPVPCCPAHILGQMNLRGDIVTVLDLRVVLGLPACADAAPAKVVLSRSGGVLLGLAVDAVLDVLSLEAAAVAPLPPSDSGAARPYLNEVAPYDGRLMALLDLERLLADEQLVVCEEV